MWNYFPIITAVSFWNICLPLEYLLCECSLLDCRRIVLPIQWERRRTCRLWWRCSEAGRPSCQCERATRVGGLGVPGIFPTWFSCIRVKITGGISSLEWEIWMLKLFWYKIEIYLPRLEEEWSTTCISAESQHCRFSVSHYKFLSHSLLRFSVLVFVIFHYFSPG